MGLVFSYPALFFIRFLFLPVLLLIRVDEGEQMLYCHLLRNVLFYANLLAIEAYTVRTGAYVAVIGIRHFAWTIHDAAHDTNLQALQVLGCLLDLGDGFTEIVESSATTRTTDIYLSVEASRRNEDQW